MTARHGWWAGPVSIGLCLIGAAGCASSESFVHKMTPAFMLSEHDRAERNLKDPKAVNLAYGKFQEQIGQAAEARKYYELALRDDPKLVDAILGIARLDQLAEKPKEAEAGFHRALQLKPHDAAVIAACGQFYASQKRWNEAFQSFNAAIAAAPKEPVYKYELGLAKTRSGDINAGLALFTEVVGPEKAHYNVAYLLKQQGSTQATAQQCKMALALDPNFEAARALLDQIESSNVAGTPRGHAPGHGAQAAAGRGRDVTYPESRADFAAGGSHASGMSQTSWQLPPRSPAAAGSPGGGRFDS